MGIEGLLWYRTGPGAGVGVGALSTAPGAWRGSCPLCPSCSYVTVFKMENSVDVLIY